MLQVVCASGFVKPRSALELCLGEISESLTRGEPRKGEGKVEAGVGLTPSQQPFQLPSLGARMPAFCFGL